MKTLVTISTPPARRRIHAFSLMEVLLAVFILGIGLIMVATIFPVGADWTRQSTEDSVAQTIAQNAVTIVQTYYAPNGLNSNTAGKLNTLGTTVVPLPSFTSIPVAERSYQYGNPTPFPAPKPSACTYFWTGLVRAQPNQSLGTSKRYDLYILVFRKGASSQTFNPPVSVNELTGARNTSNPFEPAIQKAAYAVGTPAPSATPPVVNAVPPVGFIGIGESSGTVFRQAVDLTPSSGPVAIARPNVITSPAEQVIFAVPADGTTASPLVYVYQTTISF